MHEDQCSYGAMKLMNYGNSNNDKVLDMLNVFLILKETPICMSNYRKRKAKRFFQGTGSRKGTRNVPQ